MVAETGVQPRSLPKTRPSVGTRARAVGDGILGALQRVCYDEKASQLGDFTTGIALIPLSGLGVGIGVLGAFVALILLRLIGLFTNLLFYQRFDLALVSPAGHHLGAAVVLVPVFGALIIGLMARFGSERIRGHGIPEAIEAILINGSRVEPRLAILKPLSSAISIGSGGPFGAEGPIIMTGGAFGSMIAQFLHLTSAERKTLLVAGAAAGMSATFASPVAAVLLSVELLLFEWKPRSMIPVALASGTAALVRHYLLGDGPLFPVPPHASFVGVDGLLGCVVAGLAAGVLSAALTIAVYAAEDGFRRLPIHWMWWPAIGGVVVGLGGLIFPQALGVGYDTIGALLQGSVPVGIILGVLLVKSTIWAVSLGSGTSGGVLAPLLMAGGALGGILALVLPNEGPGFWSLMAMGAILGGTMRSPFTGVVFALELTHDVNALLPLLVSTVVAHGFTVLTLRRSILTEKVSRRGFHLSREYAVDPLEILFVREVMRTSYVAISANASGEDLPVGLRADGKEVVQRLFPVVDDDGRLVGVVTRSDLTHLAAASKDDATGTPVALASVVRRDSVVAYPDEPLRTAVYRMAETGLTRFPVVERATGSLVGMVSLADLLKARVRNLEAERRRGRVLQVQRLFPPWIRRVDEDREGIPVAPPAGREEVTGMSAPSDSIGSVDELSRLLVSDVLRSDHAVIPAATPVRSLLSELQWNGKLFGSISDGPDADRWWIVTGDDNRAIGIVTASQIVHAQAEISLVRGMVADLAAPVSYCLFPDETLREAVVRMIHADRSWLPVVERADPARVLGYVTSADALASGGLRAPEEEELETAPAPRARAAGGRSAGHAA